MIAAEVAAVVEVTLVEQYASLELRMNLSRDGTAQAGPAAEVCVRCGFRLQHEGSMIEQSLIALNALPTNNESAPSQKSLAINSVKGP